MEEQLLPLLLENTAGKRGNEILNNINDRDQNNQQLSAELVQDQLQLFDEAMRLQLDALTFAAEHASQWSEADQVIVAMACRTFNHLRSSAQLLLSGYWAEYRHLERGAFEAMTREWVFFKHPDMVRKWLNRGRQGKVQQWEVNEALKNVEGDEMRATLKKHYTSLSLHIHPNRDAIDLETWNGEKEVIGRRSIIGGYISTELFPIQFAGLLVLTLTATMLLGIVGLHEATETWKQEVNKLREAVNAITAKYRSLAE